MTQAPPEAPSSRPPAGTNSRRLAIASIICGALGIVTCGVSAVLGLILGIIALTRCGQGTAPGRSRGLATAGLVVSAICMVLVVVAGPPLLGLLIIFREEMKEEVLDAWEETNPPPADDFFGGDLMEDFHLPLPAGAAPEIPAFPGTILRRPS